ncbi:MAG TPA: aldo/keto reductase [Amycolatopsis sp.]|nr:aldo/keto reductase [Amycolatopsis sp.]
MELRRLGDTGVQVSSLCLGTMMFGSMGNPDAEDCVRIVDRALDAGINFIDTADVYSRGESERILARALKGRRDDIVLATKFYNPMSREPNHRGASRRWIMRAVEDSLRRLETDYIDLYQVHRFDEYVDIDETLGALSDLVAQGKVRMTGSSTFPAERIVESHWNSERRGHVKLRCEQPPYSIFVRGIERDVLPTAQRYGMGVIVWSPLNGGWLTGKYRQGESAPEGSRLQRFNVGPWRFDGPGTERKLELVEALIKIAEQAGTDLVTLAIAFTLRHPGVTSSIIGPRTLEQLESQLGAAEFVPDPDTLDAIDAIVPPGHTVTIDDMSYTPHALRPEARRR